MVISKLGVKSILFAFSVLFLMGFAFAFPAGNEPPVIMKTSPTANSFVNGALFSVRYSAQEMDSITLSYAPAGSFDDEHSVIKTDCEIGENKKCDFSNVDISEFDGKQIDFWFKIKNSKYTIYSKKTRIKVDTTPPQLTSFDGWVNGRKVTLIFGIDDKNFKEISYQDASDCESQIKTGTFCRNLNKGVCSVTKEFCKGNHYLMLKLLDKAGNSLDKNVDFVVE